MSTSLFSSKVFKKVKKNLLSRDQKRIECLEFKFVIIVRKC